MKKPFYTRLKPVQVIVLTFLLVILAGALLLALPFSTSDGNALSLLDALFVSTSAVCVTGLSPVDVSTRLSFFGQCVLIILMEIGALGLISFRTLFSIIFGHRLGIVDRTAVQETFLPNASPKIHTLVIYVVSSTLFIEFVGAAILFIHWTRTARFATVGETLFKSIFHAVSAFTHGSFALFSDSLISFQTDKITILTIALLIIFGSIGFLVGLEILNFIRAFSFRKNRAQKPRLSIHTKLILLSTVFLLCFGTVSIFFTERNGAFAEMSLADALINSFFFSVVPRTSGFNTVGMTTLSGATCLILIFLMFVGGGSGSTAGGVKANTFAILAAYSAARLRGFSRLTIFRRTIPNEIIERATALVVISAALVIFASFLLMISETRGLNAAESRNILLPIIFETVSAFGTVGMTLDFTSKLTAFGKLVIIFVMFAGRVGTISLILAISLRQRKDDLPHAEESVMIG